MPWNISTTNGPLVTGESGGGNLEILVLVDGARRGRGGGFKNAIFSNNLDFAVPGVFVSAVSTGIA